MAAHRRSLSLRWVLVLCVFSGLLLSLAFPPAGWWFLAWIALIPWLTALRLARGGAALLGSWLGGFVFFGALCYWLGLFGISVWLLACLLLGLWLAIWGMLVRHAGRLGALARMVAAAVLWTGIEWARGLGPFGFTWGWLGYSQSPALPLLPVARAFGTLGLSWAIALANAALAELVVARARRDGLGAPLARAAVGLALAALSVFGGRAWSLRLPPPGGPELRAAVVQGSVGGPLTPEDANVALSLEEQKHALDVYERLTIAAARERPALVVWPESAIPVSPEAEAWVAARLSRVARRSGAWLIAGGHYLDPQGRTLNSAYLYSPSGNLRARYDKVKLVPFGEYVPGRSWLPFLDRYHVREFDFAAGEVHRILQAGIISLGPMICFESTFPGISWELARRQAQVLVVITNDAWFGRTVAAAQHRQIAVLRAAETGRWVLRAASTGISSIIAPDGRIVAEAGLFRSQVLAATIRPVTATQAQPRWGPAFCWLVAGLSAACVIAPLVLRRGRPAGRSRTRPAREARPPSPPRRRGQAAPR